jgi:two-component system NtrC family sensor kinase
MGRRAKSVKARREAKLPVAPKSRKNESSRVRDLEKRLAEALKLKTEALQREAVAQEQQAATAEILRVISSSPTDIQPVFDTIVESAARLCESADAHIFRRDSEQLVLAAHRGRIPARPIGEFSMPLDRGSTAGRSVLDGRTVHIADLQGEAEEFPEGSKHARDLGHRTILQVPLMREGVAIGTIGLRRIEARPFTERQVALLQSFADQAVIAIENVRLFKELETRNRDLTEALDQQTATAEILRVISQSPTDVRPVFAAMAASAARLCDAFDATIFQVDDNVLRLVAHEGPITPDPVLPITPGTVGGRVVRERRAIHVADLQAETETYPLSSGFARDRGFRTVLSVPLLHGAQAIGLIAIRRTEVRPFTDRQVALLETFADQAVIAIENVRLFTELQSSNRELTTALDQQTATSEILRVISQSPTDVQPVFDTIVESARKLFNAHTAALYHRVGDQIHIGAFTSTDDAAAEFFRSRWPRPFASMIAELGPAARVLQHGKTRHVEDFETDINEPEASKELARLRGYRAFLQVPMRRSHQVFGALSVARRAPGLFTPTEVALLRTFADQAVIAIENVRLFKELEARNRDLTEALEQQTATSEILGVISSSPTEVEPVFNAITQSAMRLCEGNFANVATYDGELLHMVAHANVTAEGVELTKQLFPMRPSRSTVLGRVVLQGAVVHIPDAQADVEYLQPLRLALRGGSAIGVPMLREGKVIGSIAVGRSEPRPFADSEMALLQTFADQAVIAIENVRLFTELQEKNRALTIAHAQVTESLEQQTATSDILRVIASSPTDAQPVFETILANAVRLCDAKLGQLCLRDGENLRWVASHGATAAIDKLVRGTVFKAPAWALRPHGPWRPLQIPDLRETEPYRQGWPSWREQVDVEGARTVVAVPLVKVNQYLGSIFVYRREVLPFTEVQVALLGTFADQAVIAIENVRLFTELQSSNRELTTALDTQTATSDILRVISQSQTNVQPVFDAIVASAVRPYWGHTRDR